MFFCFFVIDTASTRSYTYCPTPSLHAALPHSLEMGDQPPRAASWQVIFLVESEGVVMARQHRSQCFQRRIVGDAGAQPGGPMGRTPAGEAALPHGREKQAAPRSQQSRQPRKDRKSTRLNSSH